METLIQRFLLWRKRRAFLLRLRQSTSHPVIYK